MIGANYRLKADEANELGIVQILTDDYQEMIKAAILEVDKLVGNIPRVADAPVSIPEFVVPDNPVAGDLPLSREALTITARVINQAAQAQSLAEALEICYQACGDISCIDASKEGVNAFLQKRKPVFKT